MVFKPRFFIALLPPPNLQKEINQIKQHFADHYNSKKAFNAPSHITIFPPFLWPEEDTPRLETHLEQFAQNTPQLPIILSGFGAFKPRVIFIHPEKTPELVTLHQHLNDYLQTHLSLQDEKAKTRPFAPHITVAFRDLSKSNFKAAWPHFKDQSFDHQFTVSQLTLLRHNGRHWEIYHNLPFQREHKPVS
ncbi:2'-5' RNA ligase family protein [Spirulina sp. CS-785/01]|uniref:2'-5' RNA ligase family protein n=1 Tax=Spirulina sp. CS-785/01 TaxID=3021716 RepID=UPI00232E6D9B|nr:2'-5' RNA ligase family protein [Spirulina sp. CS-785/01]MDB9313378.1 2'-5' RNA ligase family protein [Spirulina sp. CS-785/01]